MVVLIGISYAISKQTILKSSSNLLASSIENQSNEIEAWLNENLSACQMAKDLIETINPDEEELLLSDEYKNFQNIIYGDLLYKRNYIQ